MKSNLALISATAFATATTAPAEAKKGGAPKVADRIAAKFATVRTDVPVPASKRGAPNELAEKLADLPVGGSLGIENKTKAQISSKLSKINNAASNVVETVVKGDEIKDANGTVIGNMPDIKKSEKVKDFAAYDVDPRTDPDKATVRIFRLK